MLALHRTSILSLALATTALFGCGSDDPDRNENKSCSVQTQTGCGAGLVCEEVDGAQPACFAPVTFQGIVIDALTEMPIQGARIVARDANDAAVSPVAVSAMDGTYSLAVPAKRSGDGTPLAAKLSLRADAAGYQTFPLAPRVAIPIDVDSATGNPPVVDNAATDIALIPLQNASGLGSISGSVVVDGGLNLAPAGALVVAGGATGIVDFKGNFVVFNVPAAASVNVHAYAAGLEIDPETVAVQSGKETPNVALHVSRAATANVTGSVQIVNGNGFGTTSVVLALKDTFVPDAARGEVPKGLRVGNVSGAYEIKGVPDGEYVLLAAFENDGLVRDPDTSIGGTALLDVNIVNGQSVTKEGFKVTGALPVISPGKDAIEEVTGTPSFSWEDDSSEDTYEIKVFDAFGTMVWQTSIPGVSGKDPVVPYAGPALTPGMIYQFRATSIKDTVPISQTEDLRGVFIAR